MMILFISGFLVGGICGVFLMCLVQVSKDDKGE